MSIGDIGAGLYTTIAVNAVIGMCNSAHRWYSPRGKFTVNQVISQLVGIVDSGVRMRGYDSQSEEI